MCVHSAHLMTHFAIKDGWRREVTPSMKVQRRTPARAPNVEPNLNAYVERFIQTTISWSSGSST